MTFPTGGINNYQILQPDTMSMMLECPAAFLGCCAFLTQYLLSCNYLPTVIIEPEECAVIAGAYWL